MTDKPHYEIDFYKGKVYGYEIPEDLKLDEFIASNIPVYSKETGKEIILNKVKGNKKVNPFGDKYLRDFFTGEYIKYDGKKIELHDDKESDIANFLINNKQEPNDKEILYVREYLINMFLGLNLYFEDFMFKDTSFNHVLKLMEKDGWEHYYKIFLKYNVFKNFIELSPKEYVRKIYYSCVFAYNNLMNKNEQKEWLSNLNYEEILDLLYFNGNLSSVNSKYIDRQGGYLYTELVMQEWIDINGIKDYDITKSKYIAYIISNKYNLYSLIEYDRIQYLILLNQINKSRIYSKIEEDFLNDVDLFLRVYNNYKFDSYCNFDPNFSSTIKLDPKRKEELETQKELLLAIKTYAPQIYFKTLIDLKKDDKKINDVGERIAVKMCDIKQATIINDEYPKEFEVKDISYDADIFYAEHHDDDYVFLISCGDGVYKEEITGLKFFNLDEIKNLHSDVAIKYKEMEQKLMGNFESMPCFENAQIITKYNEELFDRKFFGDHYISEDYLDLLINTFYDKYNAWYKWKNGTDMQVIEKPEKRKEEIIASTWGGPKTRELVKVNEKGTIKYVVKTHIVEEVPNISDDEEAKSKFLMAVEKKTDIIDEENNEVEEIEEELEDENEEENIMTGYYVRSKK